jgi:hypothetical protein
MKTYDITSGKNSDGSWKKFDGDFKITIGRYLPKYEIELRCAILFKLFKEEWYAPEIIFNSNGIWMISEILSYTVTSKDYFLDGYTLYEFENEEDKKKLKRKLKIEKIFSK